MELHGNYKDDIEIDPNNLDLECLRQPALFLKYSELLADAKQNLDRARRNLDKETARISLEIRTNPEEYTGDTKKPTEAMITALVDTDDSINRANAIVIKCRHDVEILQGIVNSFEQRKRSLNNLVSLHGQQYFSGPESTRPLNREFIKNQSAEIAKEKVRNKLAQRKDLKQATDEDED